MSRNPLSRYKQGFNNSQNAKSASYIVAPTVVWFTGLSGAGKSTTACALEEYITRQGGSVIQLDGDQMRQGLCADLGFSRKDRQENIRRIAEVAKLMLCPGHIILVSVISPFTADRETARQIIGEQNYVEIYMNAPLADCEKRDPKGLYRKARSGLIPHFTGIDSAYEPPLQPQAIIDSTQLSVSEASQLVITTLQKLGRVRHDALPTNSPLNPQKIHY